MKFAVFYVVAIIIVVFGLEGAAAGPPPVKISNGPAVNRVEYIYYDGAGNVVGNKIYDCNGWVVGWGEKGKFEEIKITPCN